MAKPRLYTDEHISKAVVAALRTNGVDVLTVPEAGTLGASDEDHLERATADGRILVTQDRDFSGWQQPESTTRGSPMLPRIAQSESCSAACC